jgi:hypothetical protein
VTRELKNLLGIEVAGMTTLAALDADGCHSSAAVLAVLTAPDCVFLPTVTASLAGGGHEERIATACREALALGPGPEDRPRLVLTFCPLGMPFSGDVYPEIFSRIMKGVPMIGGAASDAYGLEQSRVFLSGAEYRDAMVMVCLWGEVRPVFVVRHVTSRFAERLRRVTSAEGNVVHKVGEESLIRYLEGFGLKTDVSDPVLAFVAHPMMLTRDDQDEVPLMRHIVKLDHTTGAGTFFGDVPVGSLANMCLITKKNLEDSCRESITSILAAREDGRGAAVLCFSCAGRAVLLGEDVEAEGRVLSSLLPAGLPLAGAYCMGEICPTHYSDGQARNRFHNCSFTVCLL